MAPTNRLLAVRGSRPAGAGLRPITSRTPAPRRLTPRLVITNSPLKQASTQSRSQEPEKEDKGFLRGALELFTDVPEIVKGAAFGILPFASSAAQTAVNLNRIKSGMGAGTVRQAAEDFRTAREEGLTGQQLFESTFARDLPLVGQMGTSFYRTGTRGLETGLLGIPLRAAGVDLGEEGVDYKNALRRGELLGTLVEDVGNVMLAGRLAGLGSLAARTGSSLSQAGSPRLGRAVSGFGAFAEEPISTSLRGAAQLTGAVARSRANAPTAGRLAGRIASGAERVGASTTPLRTIGQGLVGGYRNLAERQRVGFVQKQNVLRDRIETALSQGLEPSQADIDALAEARRGEELWRSRTEPFKNVRRMAAQMVGEGEALERTSSQTLFRFQEKGPVPESRRNLENASKTVRQRAADLAASAKPEDNANATVLSEYADHLDRKLEAKNRYDQTGEMVQPEYINDTFAAAVILASDLGEVVRREVANGRSIPDIIASIIPDNLTEFEGGQGYLITEGAVRRALAYMDQPPEYDLLNRVGVEEALYILRSNSDFMTRMRQTGEGMVRGAGSPFETGIYPLPEFVVKELKSTSPKVFEPLLEFLDLFVTEIIQRDFPELIDKLELDLDNPAGVFEKVANARKDSPEYVAAYQAIVESFPIIRQIPEFQNFLVNPMIYPANMRISVEAEASLVKRAASEDLQAISQRLLEFSDAFPDDVTPQTLAEIQSLIDAANDPYAKYDPKNWRKAQNLINKVIKNVERQRNKLEAQRGALAARTDRNWARLDELGSAMERAYGMIQTIIDQPELFIDQAQLENAGVLRSLGQEEAATRLESAALKGQKDAIKARLKGVGGYREFAWGIGIRVTPDGPELQKQFGDRITSEQSKLLAQQQRDWVKTQELRNQQAAKEGALAEAQTLPEAGGRRQAQLAQARRTDIGGEAPLYMPTGASQIINPVASVRKQPFGTGVAPENVASFEQMRTGTVLAMTPGQAGTRIKEVLRALNRNRIIQAIVENKQFVSTVAERVSVERREQLMQQATRNIESRERATSPEPIANLIRKEYNILLMKELESMGLEPISPVEMPDPNDPYASREALKALDERVGPQDLTDTTLVMTRGMRQGLANQFINQDSARGPEFIRNLADRIGRGTGSWKSVVLPFSVRWQVGDAVGNVLNAWVRAGIPPDELFEAMFRGQGLRIREDGSFYYESPSVLQRMRTEPEIPREQGRLGRLLRRPAPEPGQAPLRETLFGERVEEYMSDPVMAAQQSAGLQTSGNKLEDIRAMRGGTLLPGPESRVGRAFFPRFRQAAFAFNEAQNTMARSAVALIELKRILDERGRSIDEITPIDAFNDPVLYEANRLAVERANEALGNFSALSPYERQVVRKVYPFWSWIRFINKAAFQLLVDQPDRVLFMAHLGAMSTEDEVDGLWDWLQGKEEIPGLGFFDLNFLNPYQDAIAFSGKPLQRLAETATSLSPIIEFPLTAAGELYYGQTGRRLPIASTLSRPGYLEGRPEESTRTLADTLGGIAYRGLRTFGGPYRNIIDVLPQEPSRLTGPAYRLLVTPEGRIRGTDVAVGPVERFGQGSPRTEGAYAVSRLSPLAGRLSAVGRTFGIPTPLVSSDVARRMAADNAYRARRALLRRINERRLANR